MQLLQQLLVLCSTAGHASPSRRSTAIKRSVLDLCDTEPAVHSGYRAAVLLLLS